MKQEWHNAGAGACKHLPVTPHEEEAMRALAQKIAMQASVAPQEPSGSAPKGPRQGMNLK
ncbi:MAG: hypothetical protein WBK91_00225 [Alphaproteobacteria bacterium]